jgi:RimJ/RimL family protein N-acetyltransferase
MLISESSGFRVRVRLAVDADYRWIYEYNVRPGAGATWPLIRAGLSESEFRATLERGDFPPFVAVDKHTGESLGYAIAERLDLVSESAHVSVFMLDRFQGRGLGAEAGGLLVSFLFEHYPVGSIYGLSYEPSLPRRGKGRFFQEEACRRQHRWFAGRYWDEHVLVIRRPEWEAFAPRFLHPRSR